VGPSEKSKKKGMYTLEGKGRPASSANEKNFMKTQDPNPNFYGAREKSFMWRKNHKGLLSEREEN